MNSLDERFDARLPLTHNLLRTVRILGEFRGKEELYRHQRPQALETLKQVAIIRSTESSNRIEGVTAPPDRVRDLVREKTTPRDRPEQEIAGYRDVLNTIHGNYRAMKLTPGLVRQVHRDLFKFTASGGGNWKAGPNSITEQRPDGTEFVRFEPVAPHLVPQAMDELHAVFARRWGEDRIDKLLLVPPYVLDFLCIHPFTDGNGRMARLLSLLLLYQAGFEVGRYISLERVIEDSKETYYDSLYQSSQGWHQGSQALLPWTEYFLGTLVAAYREFERGVGQLTASRGAKTNMVLEAIDHFQGPFSIAQVQEMAPTVGIDLIRRILQQQKNLGKLKSLGRGPLAQWQRI